MRLIDADALIETKRTEEEEKFGKPKWKKGHPSYAEMVFRESEIDNAPTVEERKHGHWIVRTDFGNGCREIRCSQCGETGFWRTQPFYCPYCGAIMEFKTGIKVSKEKNETEEKRKKIKNK